MSRIAVLGAGAWGTALAVSLARRGGHELCLWAHSPAHASNPRETVENPRSLPGFALPADIRIPADLKQAVKDTDTVLCVTPSQHLREAMKVIAPVLNHKQVLLSA